MAFLWHSPGQSSGTASGQDRDARPLILRAPSGWRRPRCSAAETPHGVSESPRSRQPSFLRPIQPVRDGMVASEGPGIAERLQDRPTLEFDRRVHEEVVLHKQRRSAPTNGLLSPKKDVQPKPLHINLEPIALREPRHRPVQTVHLEGTYAAGAAEPHPLTICQDKSLAGVQSTLQEMKFCVGVERDVPNEQSPVWLLWRKGDHVGAKCQSGKSVRAHASTHVDHELPRIDMPPGVPDLLLVSEGIERGLVLRFIEAEL